MRAKWLPSAIEWVQCYSRRRWRTPGMRGTALWTERDGNSSDPFNLSSRPFTISGNTMTWGASVPVTPVRDPSYSVFYPAATASYEGSLVSAVRQRKVGDASNTNELWSASATVSGNSISWGTPAQLDTFVGANRYAYPQLAGSANGEAITAAWGDGASGAQTLFANSASVTSSGVQNWGSKQTIGPIVNHDEYKLKLKVSQDGKTAVTGFIGQGKVRSATAAVDGANSSWGTVSELTSTTTSNEITMGLSADGARATLVWTNLTGNDLQSISGGTTTATPSVTSIQPNSGPKAGGETITIKGAYLNSAKSVTIGGVACTDLKWNPNKQELTCKVPAADKKGAVDVVVTTVLGTVTVAGGFTYTGDDDNGGKPTHVPNKPQKLKTSGTPASKKFKITWKKPTQTNDGRPVDRYRLTIVQRGPERLILKRSLPASTTKYNVTRKFLLKNSVRKRGDVSLNLLYRVRVEAINTLGGGPIATTYIRVKV